MAISASAIGGLFFGRLEEEELGIFNY